MVWKRASLFINAGQRVFVFPLSIVTLTTPPPLLCPQEDLGEHIVPGDAHPGHVGTACLLSSSFVEVGTDHGVATLPIMGRNSRQTIGKVRGETCAMPWCSGFWNFACELVM